MSEKKILLVDDEPSIRVVLTAILEQAGYVVASAEDGFAALRRMRQSVPDLVITDLRMPNMNGFELLSVVRQRFPRIPTIAISGEFLACHIDAGLLTDAFFQKGNYTVPEFLEKVATLLDSRAVQEKPRGSSVWASTGDALVMLTCTECLRSFPIETCSGPTPYPKHADCLFCGAHLDVQVTAVGIASASE